MRPLLQPSEKPKPLRTSNFKLQTFNFLTLQHLRESHREREVAAARWPQKQQGVRHPAAGGERGEEQFGALLADDVLEKHGVWGLCGGASVPFGEGAEKPGANVRR